MDLYGDMPHSYFIMRTTVGQLKRIVTQVLAETRGRVTPQEVITTFEDLYMNSMRSNRKGDAAHQEPGKVSVEELASWIGTTPEQLIPVLRPAGLVIDRQGNVSPQGLTPKPMRAVKA